jgi:dihydrofolate reductase
VPVDCISLDENLPNGLFLTGLPWLQIRTTQNLHPRRNLRTHPKLFSLKTLDKSEWHNTVLARGNLVDEITNLKEQDGKDIIAYSGATFVSALIKQGLIAEFHLFINPTAIGSGMTIFKELDRQQELTLVKSSSFDCGIVVLNYEPKR